MRKSSSRWIAVASGSAALAAILVSGASAGDGCGAQKSAAAGEPKSASCGKETAAACTKGRDVVDTAASAGSFKTLVKAVKAAGLVETLKGKGPFTVFAPTDEAFSKLPEGTLDALVKDPPKLRAVLKYHVVPGKVMAADVRKLTSAKTVLGQSVTISHASPVKVNGVLVAKTDIECSNGVIHVIDGVILPKDDIVDVASKAGSFKTLLKAVEAAGLADTLRGEGPYTVFAPTDEAFAKLPAGTLDALLKDKAKLKTVLLYHVVPGVHTAEHVVKMKKAKTAEGRSLRIDTTSGVRVDNAKVVKTDIQAANGLIHVIDAVVVPE